MRNLILGLGLSVALCSPGLADPALTTAPSAMRAAPSPRAHIVQNVPPRAEIDLSNCSKNWCYVSWRNMFGYLPVSVVAAGPNEAPPPGYAPGPPVYPPPPVVAPWGWGPFFGYGGYGHW
ncbi:MAG TPA: hypothetical protein VKS78_02025 [Roseiarcus sp.]|nr:hypothetical protein [Roseiarcus sp.]